MARASRERLEYLQSRGLLPDADKRELRVAWPRGTERVVRAAAAQRSGEVRPSGVGERTAEAHEAGVQVQRSLEILRRLLEG